MTRSKPFKRIEFIRKLRRMGFDPPETGGRHSYMRCGNYTLTLPNNREYSVPQIKMLIREIERGLHRKISPKEWEDL